MAIKNRVIQQNQNGQLADLPDAIYWPFKRLPESKLDAYAMACVETALKYSEDARAIYVKVVQSWELLGCQTLISDFVRCKQDTRNWLRDRANAAIGEPLPTWPDSWKDVIANAEGNTDSHKLLKHVAYFILIAFNRKADADIENQTLKVLPRKSLYLAQAIVFYSLLDYLEIRPELKGPKVMPDSELSEFHWFCRTLASKGTTRPSRQIRRTLRRHGFNLHHYQMILDGAEMWYRARVLCDTAREAADYYQIDPIDLSKRIEPYDDATGWPRHR